MDTPVSAYASASVAAAVEALRGFLDRHRRPLVLTGAGISTGSGIPDYRGLDGNWKRAQPVTFQAFTGSADTRRRYWARSVVGWPRFGAARANPGHRALAALDQAGRIQALVTQNVDGLHQQAGSRSVIDLHGRLDRVLCLGCGAGQGRAEFQHVLLAANPGWDRHVAATAPDGDADLEGVDLTAFQVPACPICGGMLKPDVVFYGESVPRARVEAALAQLQRSDGLLVIGSSLMVYSGLRFARVAAESGIPVAALNRGRTRADDLLTLKIEADCVPVLAALVDAGA